MISKPRVVLKNTRCDDLIVEIQGLLNEHVDIVVDGLPNEFPLVKSTNHHIDFLLESKFPNKSIYRMTPKENEEIKIQVQDLLDKGLVRESLSPCIVPIIISPKKDGGWRMCIDCRQTNKITIRYIFPFVYV